MDLGFDDVCQLLRPLLQAVCGQLLLEAQESQEAALREGCHEVSEPKDHSSHRRRQQRGREGEARAAGREESGEKTELSGLRLRVRIVPEVRGMMKFARRRQQVPVQEICTGLAATELRGGHAAPPMYSTCRST